MEIEQKGEEFTQEERETLQKFIKNGSQGIVRVDDIKMYQLFSLYMSGKSYQEVAEVSKSPIEIVLYFANKLKWHDKRIKHYDDLTNNTLQKVANVKKEAQSNVATIVSAMGKHFTENMNKYIMTGDITILQDVDVKLLNTYYKSLEILDKLIERPPGTTPPNASNVTVNINNASIKSANSDTIDVESNPESSGEILKRLADFKKAKEAENK